MTKYIFWRYAFWLFTVRMLLPLFFLAMVILIGIDFSSSGVSIIPVFVAAMMAGQRFARTMGRFPASNESWQFAFKTTLIFLLVEVFATAFWVMFTNGMVYFSQFSQLFNGNGGGFLVGLMLFLLVVAFFSNKIFVSLGAKNELKVMEKRSKKERNQ